MRVIKRTGGDFVAELRQRCKICDEDVYGDLVTPTTVGYVHAVHMVTVERIQELQGVDERSSLVGGSSLHLVHEGGQNDCVAFVKLNANNVIVVSFDDKARRGHGYRYGRLHDDI